MGSGPYSAEMKVITNKWIFKVKTLADGSLDKLKARLVARGFEQYAGVDFLETFSPVVKASSIRFVFALAASRGWSVQQLDVNNVFLNGVLEDTIFMTQPEGFVDKHHPNFVCKLKRSLYGLKQAPRAWYDTLTSSLVELGFKRCTSDYSLFFRNTGADMVLVLVYVDDILVTGDSSSTVTQIIELLKGRFKLKHLGEVAYFLGIEVKSGDSAFVLSQHKYLNELLKKTDMDQCHSYDTPMAVNTKLSRYEGESFDDALLYRSTVGALQYLTLTRPDIAFSVNKLSQFLHSPCVEHWTACKRLLRYLKGTDMTGLKFSPSSSTCIEAFADADWAGCVDDRRSTGGHCIFFGSNLVVWNSKKQDVVSRSSAESEYRSVVNATTDVMWLHSLCLELGIAVTSPHQLWCDNTSAVLLASNPVFHARTKHIEVDVHFIREKVASKFLDVGHVAGEEQVADIFTKPLTTARFHLLCEKLCLCEVPLVPVGT